MEQDVSFVALTYISNSTRTAISGCLAVLAVRTPVMKRLVLAGCTAYCLMQVLLTHNQMTALYLLVGVVVCFCRRAGAACLELATLLYAAAFAPTAFSNFRSLLANRGRADA
jgi:hypothetical protein